MSSWINPFNFSTSVAQGVTAPNTPTSAFNSLSPNTTEGDMTYFHSGNNIRLPTGSSNQVLTSNGTTPSWGQVPLTAGVSGTLPILNGGTGQTAVSTGPNASQYTSYDSNGAITANQFIGTITSFSTVPSALTSASTPIQIYTGTVSAITKLPVTSTLYVGWKVRLVNQGTNTWAVQASTANGINVIAAGSTCEYICTSTTITIAAGWNGITPISNGGTNAVTQTAALTNILGSSLVPIANGGTNLSALPTTYIQSQYAAWDGNACLSAIAFVGNQTNPSVTTTYSGAGGGSLPAFIWTGGGSITLTVPAGDSATNGRQCTIFNGGSGIVTVTDGAASFVLTLFVNQCVTLTAINTTWVYQGSFVNHGTTALQYQPLTMPSSETFSTTSSTASVSLNSWSPSTIICLYNGTSTADCTFTLTLPSLSTIPLGTEFKIVAQNNYQIGTSDSNNTIVVINDHAGFNITTIKKTGGAYSMMAICISIYTNDSYYSANNGWTGTKGNNFP